MKILVVDDEPMYRNLLEDMLKREGYTIFTATNGEEGVAILRSAKIDFVISDVYMPVMDGLKFIKAARDIPGYENTPFLFISGHDDEHTKAAVQAAKDGGFIIKTKVAYELKEWITYLLLPKERRPSTPPGTGPGQSFTRTGRRDDGSTRR